MSRACAIQYVKVFLCSCLHAVCGTCIFFTLASRRTIHQRCFLSPFRSYNPDAHRGQQELVVLRGVDPQQREGVDLRRAAQGPEDVDDFRWQHDCHPGGLEACGRAVHGYVPPEGFPPLVRFCFFFSRLSRLVREIITLCSAVVACLVSCWPLLSGILC